MAAKAANFETHHQDMIHDSQPDYYGKRIATCSSDRTIKIFDIESRQLLANLQGHEGPVWQVSWAHPKYGSLLASCSYDHRVLVWKEVAPAQWTVIYDHSLHSASVNSVAFAPHEFGLILACASSDGFISVVTYQDDSWHTSKTEAHSLGCNSVSWGGYLRPGALVGTADGPAPLQLVSGGCDNMVKIWALGEDKNWQLCHTLKKHGDWVRDVAWAPSIGLPSNTIASCSQDRLCVIWSQDETGAWKPRELPKFPAPVWRVSWSITGNILAVSSGDNRVTLWKEVSDGEWKIVSAVTEAGVTDQVS